MIGKTIGHYKIVQRLGRGAMGEVYRAVDQRLRRDVALKFLGEDRVDDRSRRRFLREARAVSRLDHRNICMVYEINEAPDGRMYIVMGYYRGESIGQRLTRGALSVPDAIESAVEIADGLDYAHKQGVVHRDLKPANLIIEESGNIRIVDFGLAKLVDYTSMTDKGAAVGTIAYMSPEQATGKTVDGRSDIFSLGAVLYEMITGSSPFESDTAAAILYKVLHEDPKELSSSQTSLAPELNRIIKKALAKKIEDRYQTAEECRDDLLAVLEKLDPARASRWKKLNTRVRDHTHRHPVVTASAMALLLIVVTTLVWNKIGGGGEAVNEREGVAILPLKADQGSAALARGLEEDIFLRLAEGSGSSGSIWIFPLDRTRQIGANSVEEAAKTLGVTRVLAGSLRESRSEVAVTLNLIDAVTGTIKHSESIVFVHNQPKWSDPLAPALGRMFELPSSARETLGTQLTPRTGNAYRWYIKGMGMGDDAKTLDDAIKAYRKVIEEDSVFAIVHVRLGLSLLRSLSVTDSMRAVAFKHLRTGVRLARGVSFVHRSYGQRLNSAGDHRGALSELAEAARLNPSDPLTHRIRAQVFLAMQQPMNVEQAYKDEINACPAYFGGYEDLGYYYYTQGSYEDAVSQFLRVRGVAPDYAPTYNYLGALYLALDRWDEARESFERSFELGKNYAACSNLGTCYYYAQRFKDAAAMYELALEYVPGDYGVVGNLGDAYYWMPDGRDQGLEYYRQALSMARKELTRSPNDPSIYAMIGGYQATLDPDSAAPYIERSLELAPEIAEINYRACIAYELLGRRSRALALLGKAIDLEFSTQVVKSEPFLEELRKDSRFALLIAKDGS